MTHTDYLWFTTPQRRAFVRITDEVRDIVKRSGVRDGMVRRKRVVVKVMGEG